VKLLIATAAVVLAASGVPAAHTTGAGDPQTSVTETKDRLPPERMEQLVARPMSILRKTGLAAAQKDFEALLADAGKSHGKGSVEEADLLTAFGVQLYIASSDDNNSIVANASLQYLQRAIPAYRAAFGAHNAEVALALNSYSDALLAVKGDGARADAQAALEQAYSIRLSTLGADNPETAANAEKLAELRDGTRAFTAKNETAKAIMSAVATVQVGSNGSETLTVADMSEGELWKPGMYFDPLIDDFIVDSKRLDNADPASRQTIAAKYDLTGPALEAMVSFLREMEKDGYNERRRPQLRKDALHLLDLSNRASIALMFAAGALGQLGDGGCSATDVTQLMDGSRDRDRDLWAIATSCSSSRALAMAIDGSSTARPALSYVALYWTNADPAEELAAADMLLTAEFLARVDARRRDAVHAEIAAYKLTKLLHLGLLSDALTFGDSLPPHIHNLALSGRSTETRTSIGGFPLNDSAQSASPAIEYASALALAGRNAEARALLETVAPGSKLRSARACLDGGAMVDCGVGEAVGRLPLGALIVEQLLDDPARDPYVLMEEAATGSNIDEGVMTDALCRLLSRPDELKECQDLRALDIESRAPEQYDDQSSRVLWAAIGRAGGRPFDAAKATYRAKLNALGSAKSASRDWTRVTVDPAPVPFRELPIPEAALGKHPLPSLSAKALAPLPEGYTLVRAERSGKRVVAISLSQRFDPDGEVTAGGYWLHLSDDGGNTWQPPLYSGLAEHFPYVVPASSHLPMIAGDRIHLEVEESLIDTASISYPPVATRVRRKRTGIYLDIPTAELRKDSNGDGITDLAAHHLLLDGKTADSAPFVVGNDRACSKAPSIETLARLEILKKLFQVQARALIEPAGAKGFHFGGWRKMEPTAKPPIFLVGNPDDYRCVSIDRLMVVYPDADQEQLRKFSPDFHLIEVPPIHWNREHTRGFVKWSTGWAGGTYRLVREGSGWKIESIGEWIT
jgi:soluble P-type ATPase